MTNLYKKLDRPHYQAIAVFGGALLLMLAGWALSAIGMVNHDPLFAWSIGGAFMLFYAILNSLMSLRTASFPKYWAASMYSYLGLTIATSLSAWAFSGIPLNEAGSYRWIYIVVTFGFLVFLSMVNFIKIIVRYAEKEEWNEPRKRRR